MVRSAWSVIVSVGEALDHSQFAWCRRKHLATVFRYECSIRDEIVTLTGTQQPGHQVEDHAGTQRHVAVVPQADHFAAADPTRREADTDVVAAVVPAIVPEAGLASYRLKPY